MSPASRDRQHWLIVIDCGECAPDVAQLLPAQPRTAEQLQLARRHAVKPPASSPRVVRSSVWLQHLAQNDRTIDSVRAHTLKNAREIAFESRDDTLLLLCCERHWNGSFKSLLTKQGPACTPRLKVGPAASQGWYEVGGTDYEQVLTFNMNLRPPPASDSPHAVPRPDLRITL